MREPSVHAPLVLARIRAQSAAEVTSDVDIVERAAAFIGRRLVPVEGNRFVLGSAVEVTFDPSATGVTVRRLTPVRLVVLGVTIGLCWTDRDGPIWPGEPTTLQAICDTLRELGAVPETTWHAKGALRNELSAANLIQVDGDEVRLGPAIAAWSPGQIDNLRRVVHILPEPAGV